MFKSVINPKQTIQNLFAFNSVQTVSRRRSKASKSAENKEESEKDTKTESETSKVNILSQVEVCSIIVDRDLVACCFLSWNNYFFCSSGLMFVCTLSCVQPLFLCIVCVFNI